MKPLSWRTIVACFVAGALLVLAFAPFEYFPISFISVAILFRYWQHLSPSASFWSGLAFGYGLYGIGVSWVYVSLATYGGMPFWMGAIAVLGFAGILALFVACTGWCAARFFANHRLLALPGLWVVFEWMQSWVLTGFPWLDLGYTQTPSWLFALAPIGGVYLVSLSVAMIAACLVHLVAKQSSLWAIVCIGVVSIVALLVNEVQWSEPVGEPLVVGIVQPNTPIEKKWRSNYRDGLLTRLAQESAKLKAEASVDLVIWPETALPLYLQQTDNAFWQSIVPSNTALLTGIMDSPSLATGSLQESYNAAVLLCGDDEPQLYRKRHLVPFGEYLPLRFLFSWVLEYLDLPMSDFSSWQGQQTLACDNGINLGLSICYEDAFAGEHQRHVGDATLLVNISEDAWFGDSLAPHQRLQMAQMRARELARPLLRSANSGPSVVISEHGKVLAQTQQFKAQTLSHTVQPRTGDTLYKQFGNWVIYILLTFLVAVLVYQRKRR
ncbi:MAG: apolipoprotein N-acyltransferase [Cryomorphaceae bacterium]